MNTNIFLNNIPFIDFVGQLFFRLPVTVEAVSFLFRLKADVTR